MITIYRSTEAGLESIARPAPGCWVEVTDPDPGEMRSLAEGLRIPMEFVTTSLALDEIPHIVKEERLVFILVRVPYFRGATASVPYLTLPMGMIVSDEQVITICQRPFDLLRDLPHEHQADLSTGNPTRFVLHLIWSVANRYLHHQSEIDKVVEKLEDRLQKSLQNREVMELLRYQKSLVHFITGLRANETVLERLEAGEFFKLDRKNKNLLHEAVIETRQAMGVTQVASDILSQMMDAFTSIISNNLNVVMKFMAAVTIILLVPQIIGAFYGMNVRLPMEDNPWAFLLLVGLSAVCSLLIGWIFRKKGWL